MVVVSHHGGRGWSLLESQCATNGRCQDHSQDDTADDDHDLLLQGEKQRSERRQCGRHLVVKTA